ncbi:hypothetical protein JHK85_014677 [Glycine max]|nr:hypothetical protein JHK87_014210 [Glycine soja]KAG5030695.1 hypothetical protein JHK85_014677 [Glycine max]
MDPQKIENPPCRTIQQQRPLPLKVHFEIPKTYIQMCIPTFNTTYYNIWMVHIPLF